MNRLPREKVIINVYEMFINIHGTPFVSIVEHAQVARRIRNLQEQFIEIFLRNNLFVKIWS